MPTTSLQSAIPTLTLDKVRKPEQLYQYLQQLSGVMQRSLQQQPVAATSAANDTELYLSAGTLASIRDALEHSGSHPLNVDGLPGVLGDTQLTGLVIASALPSVAAYPVGTMAVVTGTPDAFYYLKSGTPNTWQSISVAPTNMLTTDTAQSTTAAAAKKWLANQLFGTVTGTASSPVHSVGATGRVGSFPTVLTSDAVLSENNGAAYFTAIPDATSSGGLRVRNSGAGATISASLRYNPATTAWEVLIAGTLLASIDTNGLLSVIRSTGGVLIQTTDAAPAASTELLRVVDNAAARVFSVDYEGDVICRDVSSSGFVRLSSAAKLFSGSGAPGLSATSGDYYFRTDTPSTANQRIYVCTGGAAWTGIV